MGNIDTQWVTSEELKRNRELLMKEFEEKHCISDNMLELAKNDNMNMTIRLLGKWILQALLAILGISNVITKIQDFF